MKEVNRLYLSTIETIAMAIDAKDKLHTVIFEGCKHSRSALRGGLESLTRSS